MDKRSRGNGKIKPLPAAKPKPQETRNPGKRLPDTPEVVGKVFITTERQDENGRPYPRKMVAMTITGRYVGDVDAWRALTGEIMRRFD